MDVPAPESSRAQELVSSTDLMRDPGTWQAGRPTSLELARIRVCQLTKKRPKGLEPCSLRKSELVLGFEFAILEAVFTFFGSKYGRWLLTCSYNFRDYTEYLIRLWRSIVNDVLGTEGEGWWTAVWLRRSWRLNVVEGVRCWMMDGRRGNRFGTGFGVRSRCKMIHQGCSCGKLIY